MVEYEDERQSEHAEDVQREREEEEEEMTVVATPHAVVHPRAVVVKRLKHTGNTHSNDILHCNCEVPETESFHRNFTCLYCND